MPYQDLTIGRVSLPRQMYHITTVTENRYPYFADLALARIVIGEMKIAHESGLLDSLAWVLMPDHLHWLLQLGEDANLSRAMNAFKGRTARKVNARLQRRGSVWQRAFYDHALRKEEDIRAIARYIVANPLRKGLVEHIGDYPHWDAMWL